MCNHDDNKNAEYLEVFDFLGYEIYRCECGALFNIQDERNYTMETVHVMTADEITKMMEEIIHPVMQTIDDTMTELKLKYDELKKRYGDY